MLARVPSHPVIAMSASRASHPEWSVAVPSTRKQKSARRSRRGARKSPARKRRWVVLTLALGVAAIALYVLVTVGSHGPFASGPPPLDDIDDASRVRLEQVLLDAELREERGR